MPLKCGGAQGVVLTPLIILHTNYEHPPPLPLSLTTEANSHLLPFLTTYSVFSQGPSVSTDKDPLPFQNACCGRSQGHFLAHKEETRPMDAAGEISFQVNV